MGRSAATVGCPRENESKKREYAYGVVRAPDWLSKEMTQNMTAIRRGHLGIRLNIAKMILILTNS